MRKSFTLAAVVAVGAVLLSLSCGGSSPTGASATPPTTLAPDDIQVSTSPAPGSTVNVGTECTASGCTTAVNFTFTVTYSQATNSAEIYYQLFDGQGRECAFGFTDGFNLPAHQALTVQKAFLDLQC